MVQGVTYRKLFKQDAAVCGKLLPNLPSPTSLMTGGHYKSLFKSPLWIRIVLNPGRCGQVQRLPTSRVASDSTDRLLIEENPSLRHANRNHGDSSIERLYFTECRDYLIQSCFRSCCIGVSMDKEHLKSRLNREYDSYLS